MTGPYSDSMALIIQILDRHLRPVAEINTAYETCVELTVRQRPEEYDEFFQPNLLRSWVSTYEQKMLDPAPEQPTLWHQAS